MELLSWCHISTKMKSQVFIVIFLYICPRRNQYAHLGREVQQKNKNLSPIRVECSVTSLERKKMNWNFVEFSKEDSSNHQRSITTSLKVLLVEVFSHRARPFSTRVYTVYRGKNSLLLYNATMYHIQYHNTTYMMFLSNRSNHIFERCNAPVHLVL